MTWADRFRDARGRLSQSQAAAALSGPAPDQRCSVRTIQSWESGQHAPPGWVQWLILAELGRARQEQDA